MTHSCDVERPGASPGVDGYNQPLPATFTTVLTGQKCDVGQQSVTVMTGEQQTVDRAMVVGRYKFSFPYGTDIRFTDRLKNVKDREGKLFDALASYYEVKELMPDDTALSVAVQVIH